MVNDNPYPMAVFANPVGYDWPDTSLRERWSVCRSKIRGDRHLIRACEWENDFLLMFRNFTNHHDNWLHCENIDNGGCEICEIEFKRERGWPYHDEENE